MNRIRVTTPSAITFGIREVIGLILLSRIIRATAPAMPTTTNRTNWDVRKLGRRGPGLRLRLSHRPPNPASLTSVVNTVDPFLALTPGILTIRPGVLRLVDRLTIHPRIPLRQNNVLLDIRSQDGPSNPVPAQHSANRFLGLFIPIRQRCLETLDHVEPLIPSLWLVVLGLHKHPKR